MNILSAQGLEDDLFLTSNTQKVPSSWKSIFHDSSGVIK